LFDPRTWEPKAPGNSALQAQVSSAYHLDFRGTAAPSRGESVASSSEQPHHLAFTRRFTSIEDFSFQTQASPGLHLATFTDKDACLLRRFQTQASSFS